MQHITYRPVDRQFGCLERDLPPGAPFNRTDPIPGITFGFALETRYPEEVYFGTVDGEVADNPAIELRAITEAEYDAAEAAEMEAREAKANPPVDPYADFVPVPLLRQRIEKLGMLDAFAAYLGQRPTLMMKVFTLERGVDPAYPDLATAFDEMDIPDAFRAYILAPPSAGVGEAPTMG